MFFLFVWLGLAFVLSGGGLVLSSSGLAGVVCVVWLGSVGHFRSKPAVFVFWLRLAWLGFFLLLAWGGPLNEFHHFWLPSAGVCPSLPLKEDGERLRRRDAYFGHVSSH